MDNYGQYNDVRQGLVELADDFWEAAGLPKVYHQLIYAPEDGNLSEEAWAGFVKANKGSLLSGQDAWEQWEVLADGSACSRFYGYGSKAGLDEFVRLASTGARLLLQLQELFDAKVPMPPNARALLGSPLPSRGWGLPTGYHDFLLALHDTDRTETTYLRVVPGFWMASQPCTGDDAEDAAQIERLLDQRTSPREGGEPFPTHPFMRTLERDAIRSAFDAVRVWLDSEDVIYVGVVEEPSIYLPAAEDGVADETTTGEHEPVAVRQQDVPLRPHYDVDRRVLMVGNHVIKQFRQPSSRQEQILKEFQDLGWPPKMDDPIVWKGVDQRDGLGDTIKALNKAHRTRGLIHFEGDGTGEAIIWSLTTPD